ncbi:MAG TPA: hypothetical protein ENK66_00150, partial [Arcobacter sp.]|nr:hypothetical protein [Arcobacter sp.]
QTVSINISFINSKPIATSNSFEVVEISSNPNYNIFNNTLTASDSDNDTLTYHLVENTTNGTIAIDSNGSYEYSNFIVADGNKSVQFSYKVYDGNEYSDIKTVTLKLIDIHIVAVVQINGVEILRDNTLNISENTLITFDASDSYQHNETITNYVWEDQSFGSELATSAQFNTNNLALGTHNISLQINSSATGSNSSSRFSFTINITSDSQEPPTNILFPNNGNISFPPQIP